ncbi:MAG: protein-arginine deiminase family protein [Myxococcota bacterium]
MAAVALLLLFAGCGEEDPEEQEVEEEERLSVILCVDADRDGVVDLDDPEDLEHRFDPAPGYGALFLPDFDDASGRCARRGNEDADWEACHDAALADIANELDLAGMARILTSPLGDEVPEGATGNLTIDDASIDRIRLHRRTGEGEGPEDFVVYEPGDPIDAPSLAAGIEFAVEGLSWAAGPEEWSGRVELTFSVELPGEDEPVSDRAHMDVAPIIFTNQMNPTSEIFVSDLGRANSAFRGDLRAAVQQAGVPGGLTELDAYDPWVQDFMHTAYVTIPGPTEARTMRVYFRSANLNYPGSLEPVFESLYAMEGEPMPTLLREDGVLVYTHFHGPERAGRAEYHPEKGFEPIDLTGVDVDDVARYLYGSGSNRTYPHIADHIDKIWAADTLDSFGNMDTTPPYTAADGTHYPFGRVYRGHGGAASPDLRPDPTLSAIVEGQGLQPTLWLYTTWLLVGHVDETLSFVPSETERGFSLLHSAPLEAVEVLERVRDEGGGSALLFEGLQHVDDYGWPLPAEVTVSEVLNDPDVMAATARAEVEVAAQLELLMEEMQLTDEDLVPLPFLYEDIGWGGLSAYQPGMVNGLSLNAQHFAPPQPEGPVIGGEDVFEALVEERLSPLGITVNWIDSWDVYHVGLGHVHCGTNSDRVLPDVPWWTEEVER